MTNQEFISTLKPDIYYDAIDGLFHRWGRQWTNTRDAIISWLVEEYNPENFGYFLYQNGLLSNIYPGNIATRCENPHTH